MKVWRVASNGESVHVLADTIQEALVKAEPVFVARFERYLALQMAGTVSDKTYYTRVVSVEQLQNIDA